MDAHDPSSAWQARDAWRLGAQAARRLTLEHAGVLAVVEATAQGDSWTIQREGDTVMAHGGLNGERLSLQVDGQLQRARVVRNGGELYLFSAQGVRRFTVHDPVSEADQGVVDAGSLVAPMPGRIVATLVMAGTTVSKGTPLLVLEAMKMEHTLQAPADGTVQGYRVKAGDQVGDGAVLVDFEVG